MSTTLQSVGQYDTHKGVTSNLPSDRESVVDGVVRIGELERSWRALHGVPLQLIAL